MSLLFPYSLFRTAIHHLCIASPLWGNPPIYSGFPSQRASNTESISMSSCHELKLRQRQISFFRIFSSLFPIVHHRDLSVYGPSQWKTPLQCNIISHWLSPYPEGSLPPAASWSRQYPVLIPCDYTRSPQKYYSCINVPFVQMCTNSMSHPKRTVNTLRPRQNGRSFADDIFKCIFLNENI